MTNECTMLISICLMGQVSFITVLLFVTEEKCPYFSGSQTVERDPQVGGQIIRGGSRRAVLGMYTLSYTEKR